jgi:hypothetical protein
MPLPYRNPMLMRPVHRGLCDGQPVFVDGRTQGGVMRLRLRQSGVTAFTLERPAALDRDAQSNMLERIVPWLGRTRAQLAGRIKSAAEAVVPWVRRVAAAGRQTMASAYERSVPWLGQTSSRLRERLRSTGETIVPATARAGAQLREKAVGLSATAAPRLRAARERLEERTVSTVDSLRPRIAQARQHGQKRIEAFREAAGARRRAGVPIWATVLLVVVAALVAQALAHQSVERRHELETRQLTQIYKSEQAASQARAVDELARESEEVHQLLGTSIAWTIASALTRKKNNELDLYFQELTKNGHIDLVLFADTKGKVMLTSNPDLRGADFEQHFPAALLREATVSIHRGAGATNRLVMPVHRLGVRLGTAMLVYRAR